MNIIFFSGGLFDVTDMVKGESRQETAFRYAVERINHNPDLLPRSRLSAQIEKIPPHDSFHTSKRGEKKILRYANRSAKGIIVEFSLTDFAHELTK